MHRAEPDNSVVQDASTNAMLVVPVRYSRVFSRLARQMAQSLPHDGNDAGSATCRARAARDRQPSRVSDSCRDLRAHQFSGTVLNELGCQRPLLPTRPSRKSRAVTNGMPGVSRVAASATPGPASQFQLALAGPPCFDFDRNRNGVTELVSRFRQRARAYPTTLADNGARHRAFSGIFLAAA